MKRVKEKRKFVGYVVNREYVNLNVMGGCIAVIVLKIIV